MENHGTRPCTGPSTFPETSINCSPREHWPQCHSLVNNLVNGYINVPSEEYLSQAIITRWYSLASSCAHATITPHEALEGLAALQLLEVDESTGIAGCDSSLTSQKLRKQHQITA